MIKMRSLLLALLAAASALQAQKLQVRLSPRDHVGHKYSVAVKGRSFERISAADGDLKNADYRIEFEGQAEILQIDDKGEPIRLAFTVTRFTKVEGGKTTELLRPGSIVLADGGLEKPISLKEGEIGEEASEAFGVVYAVHKPGDATDDEVFGTKEPRTIGESWPMNATLAAEDLKRKGINIPAERLHGKTRLVARDSVGGADCLSVQAEFEADGLIMRDVAPGLTMDRGTVDAALDGCYPSLDSRGSYRSGAAHVIPHAIHFERRCDHRCQGDARER